MIKLIAAIKRIGNRWNEVLKESVPYMDRCCYGCTPMFCC